MQCPICERTWPDEFKGCPICLVPFSAALEEEASGAIAQGPDAQAAGERGVAGRDIGGSVVTGDESIAAGGHVIFAEKGATVIIGEAPVTMTAVDRESALGRYLQHVISRNRYLQLQGIRSGGRLVHIELDQIYVTLRATRQRVIQAEEEWLAHEAALAPGELGRLRERPGPALETVTVSVNEALAAHARLAVLGDPGGGKTTLLRYLALLHARDLAEGTALVRDRLGLDESGRLPVLLPLRQIGAFLRAQRPAEDGTEGHALLLDFLAQSLRNERIELPSGFFDEWLADGRAVVLLDGLDEVADPDLRRRVSRLVEAFTCAYPACRYAVTSRIVGYTGAARLGEDYATTTVRDFSLADVERFLANWHRLVAIGQMGPGDSAEAYATEQTRQLLAAIRANERIRELAINPLMLTVIAMVHRDRVKLPDRRAELYGEAVDVLLGKWEEAKGLAEQAVLDGRPFDTGDRRLMLQSLALRMHEEQRKEIAAGDLRRWLGEMFRPQVGESRVAERAVDRFLGVIEERTGLLVARGEGVCAFSHLTFQEYLAALAVAARDDYVVYSLAHMADPWWREVILLEAGYLSLQSQERTTHLIRAIADAKEEAEPYHNLVLAVECLRDVGSGRLEGDLLAKIELRIRNDVDRSSFRAAIRLIGQARVTPTFRRLYDFMRPHLPKWFRPTVIRFIGVGSQRRRAAARALAEITGVYWVEPYGEPEWIDVPAGEFLMGSGLAYEREQPVHRARLERFRIARVPLTNAQYRIFVDATGHRVPSHWEDGKPLRGFENHPVVEVNWYDALAYCDWLSAVTNRAIALPTEAQWEKAARGHLDGREYPWGDAWDSNFCNSAELALGSTTPVGIMPEGASPYGCLDMVGNISEWTVSLWGDDKARPDFHYPYNPTDGRENIAAGDKICRVIRGGSYYGGRLATRCAFREPGNPASTWHALGFRPILMVFGS